MTSLEISMAAADDPRAERAWRAELIETIRLAWPMALTQLGQIAMMTTDLALLGRLGDVAVAAAALAHIILLSTFVLGMGLVSAVAPLAAQAYGAREPRVVRRALRVGLWAAAFLGVPLTIANLWGEDLLRAAGQTDSTAALAGQYLTGLAWCLIPAWWFIALRSFMGAVNRPEPGLWITLAAIPANALLAYGLIYGAFGLPRLELLGAGIATSLVDLGMCAVAIWVCYACRPFKKYRVLGNFWRADWPLMVRLLAIGTPISGAFLLEYGLFAAAALLVGWIGTSALAAHQVALQVASIMFMVPYGISLAATVRVGHAVGRRDATASRRAGWAAVVLGAVFMAAMSLLVITTRDAIPRLFLGSEAPETIALASMLLVLGACFFIADGIQTVGNGALRGLNDTRVPLLFSAVSYWIVGFASSYVLAFPAGLGTAGIWTGFTVALALQAALLLWRFHALTTRGYLPAPTEPAKSDAATSA
jgi:MATE family multidrug resistance protein